MVQIYIKFSRFHASHHKKRKKDEKVSKTTKFDNNGWAAPAYTKENGQVVAYNPNYAAYGALRDCWAVGFAPQAPFHFMAHLSLNF